jgi:hypothetical protein
MNIAIFDTETIDLEKPFCYNVGYVILNIETGETVKKDFVVEQVWHNKMLFNTAYYKDKMPIYIARMRGRTTVMNKWGYIMQEMIRDFEYYEITQAYAYNCSFDERVFDFNCEWFKTANPFDNIEIYDIRGYVHCFIAFSEQYKNFCESHELFTESGNYSTTAESVYRFVSGQVDFNEEHTALADSEIESEILLHCVKTYGAILGEHYKTYKNIPRLIDKVMNIVVDGEIIDTITYKTKRVYDNKIIFHTQGK